MGDSLRLRQTSVSLDPGALPAGAQVAAEGGDAARAGALAQSGAERADATLRRVRIHWGT